MREQSENTFEMWLKAIGPLLGVAAFVWGIYTYEQTAKAQVVAQIEETKQILEAREYENKRIAETRRVEASRPFLDKQLILYTEVAKTTAIIATSENEPEWEKATARFYELYYGELVLVERNKVASAMVKFEDSLSLFLEREDRILYDSRKNLRSLAYELAVACREELAKSWGTDAWNK